MPTEPKPTHAELKTIFEEAKKNLLEARRKFAEAGKALRKRRKRDKETVRKAGEMDDPALIEKSRVWHTLFGNHLATFMTFDAALDNPFGIAWLAKIDAFEAFPTDETMVDDVEIKGQTVDENIKAVLHLTDDLEYFVKRAFPGDERKLQEFAFDKLRVEVPNYVPRLALLCYTMDLLSADYAAELALAGMPPALPGNLDTATTALANAERQQEYAKRLRLRATTQRIKMFNELWAIHQNIKAAAQIIFRDKKVVAEQFG